VNGALTRCTSRTASQSETSTSLGPSRTTGPGRRRGAFSGSIYRRERARAHRISGVENGRTERAYHGGWSSVQAGQSISKPANREWTREGPSGLCISSASTPTKFSSRFLRRKGEFCALLTSTHRQMATARTILSDREDIEPKSDSSRRDCMFREKMEINSRRRARLA